MKRICALARRNVQRQYSQTKRKEMLVLRRGELGEGVGDQSVDQEDGGELLLGVWR